MNHRISWLGQGNCNSIPRDVQAKLNAKNTCACDNVAMGTCMKFEDPIRKVDEWNTVFDKNQMKDRISWLGQGNCNSIPSDVQAKLNAKKAR